MPHARLNAALLGACLIGLAIPILLVPIPQALDYPNHLARIWLLSQGLHIPPTSGMYSLEWSALTNIGVDLMAIPLGHLLPAEAVGQLFLWLGAALPVLGMAALNARLYGGLSWWQLGFGLVAWNLTLLAGFLNFNIGLGLALLAAAADPWMGRAGRPWVGFLLRVLVGFALGVVHIFALFLWGAVLCGLALGPELRPLLAWRGLLARAVPVLRAGAPALLALVLLLALAPAMPWAHEEGSSDLALTIKDSLELLARPGKKLRNGLAAVQTWRLKPDLLALLLVLAPAGLALAIGRLRAHAGLFVVVACMGVLFLAFPDYTASTGWLDRRFAQYALVLSLVALRPELPARFAPALAALMALVVTARTGLVGAVWWARSADVRSVARALEPVPAGATLLPLEHTGRANEAPLGRTFMDGFPTYWHLYTLAVPWRHAFVPTVFAARGKQPLGIRPPWDELAATNGGAPPTVHALTDPVIREWFRDNHRYLAHWRRFDYALILNADMEDQYGPVRLPPEMELVRDEGFAQLWRIVQEPAVAEGRRDGPASAAGSAAADGGRRRD